MKIYTILLFTEKEGPYIHKHFQTIESASKEIERLKNLELFNWQTNFIERELE